MPRVIVPLVTGEKYHIFNRGVDKRVVFGDKEDYLRFYQSLDVFNTIEPAHNFLFARGKKRSRNERLVSIEAYSLLPNHFHLIIEQLVDDGIGNFMKKLLGGYTLYFNEKNDRSGALFQGTYKRIHIDTFEYYNYLFAYVNENHFVHKIDRDEDIYYSSSPHYQGISKSKLLPGASITYRFSESMELAQMISKKREIIKCES